MARKKKLTAYDKSTYVWGVARLALGFTFLWAFLDKLIGLGFATCRDKAGTVTTMCSSAWLKGGSPTNGFLSHGVTGPFEAFYHNLAGNTFIDWLFMMGLLLIGLSLITGIGVRVAATTGSLLLFLMWTATLWPANNPVIDEHIIYIIVLTGICLTNKDQKLGLGSWWRKQSIVQKMPILE